MHRLLSTTALLAGLTLFALPAQAQITSFVSNPQSNSTNWANFVTGFGANINRTINFDTHPVGTLQSDFYLGSAGVTLTGTTGVNTVLSDEGPGDFGSGGFNTGEGLHSASGYLYSDGTSSLTVSFATKVSGFGLSTIDYYNFNGAVPLILSAYSGANGTGQLLGQANSLGNISFQQNYLYFMGVATSDGTDSIGSIVFSNPQNGDAGTADDDFRGLDNFVFSRVAGSATAAAPEPGSMALAVVALPFMGGIIRRRFHRTR